MGLQYAKKLGYSQVHAISTNKSKEEESKNFGADKFILFQDEEGLNYLVIKFKKIIEI